MLRRFFDYALLRFTIVQLRAAPLRMTTLIGLLLNNIQQRNADKTEILLRNIAGNAVANQALYKS